MITISCLTFLCCPYHDNSITAYLLSDTNDCQGDFFYRLAEMRGTGEPIWWFKITKRQNRPYPNYLTTVLSSFDDKNTFSSNDHLMKWLDVTYTGRPKHSDRGSHCSTKLSSIRTLWSTCSYVSLKPRTKATASIESWVRCRTLIITHLFIKY